MDKIWHSQINKSKRQFIQEVLCQTKSQKKVEYQNQFRVY